MPEPRNDQAAAQLREWAWFGSRPGDSLYGLRPLPAELAFKLLMLAARLESK